MSLRSQAQELEPAVAGLRATLASVEADRDRASEELVNLRARPRALPQTRPVPPTQTTSCVGENHTGPSSSQALVEETRRQQAEAEARARDGHSPPQAL